MSEDDTPSGRRKRRHLAQIDADAVLRDEGGTLDFGPLLRNFRLARGISQETLAERARLSATSISSLERGARRAPYRQTVNALAAALGLDAREQEALAGAAVRPRGPRTPQRRPVASRIPSYATAFIGRERECRELTALLGAARLIVLCGFGGIGKTRLAVEVTTRLVNRRAGEAYFVDFSSVRDPALVVPHVAAVFKVAAGAQDLDTLTTALAQRECLLVLDNCEPIVEECARVVEVLLRACPGVRVLATSREPLQIDGETLYRLESLDPAHAGIELFVDRIIASRAAGGDAPDRRTASAIVRRLDGIPLAIELAAGLARTRSLEEILKSLAGREFLTIAERRSSVGHHRTMRAAIEWSYDSLDADEQTDLRMLGYPCAGMTRAGALAVCGRADDRNLRRLVDMSLVLEDRTSGRMRLHEITRQFVASFDLQSETNVAADRYARYLGAQMCAAFERGWQSSSADSYEPFAPLVPELDNLRQAFRYALDVDDRSLALELAAGPDYWTAVGRVPEGYEWLERVVHAVGNVDHDPRSAVLAFGLMLCAIQSGRPERVLEFAAHTADLAARHDLPVIGGRALIVTGHVALARDDARAAADWFEKAIARFTAIKNKTGIARARAFLAFALIELGEADAAEAIVREFDRGEQYEGGGEPSFGDYFVQILLADIARLRADLTGSLRHGRAALALFVGGPITSMHARAVHGLVEVLILSGNLDEAQDIAAAELREFAERGFHTEVALLLEVGAALLLRRSRVEDAARAAYFADAVLRGAKRSRMRFAAALYRWIHGELAMQLSIEVREQLAQVAARSRTSDVIALFETNAEVYG